MSKTIKTTNSNLLEDAPFSSLNSSATSGGGTISVYSVVDFAVNDVLLIGEFGQEGAEIIKTHGSTAPLGTTVTLASNLVKDHTKDTKVYVLPYDQVQFYHADTIAGTKTQMGSNTDINEEGLETIYTDAAYTSGYYFTRFFNSVESTYSDYSDPIPYSGFGSNTVGYLVNLVMKELKKEFSENLTYDMMIDEINACLRFVRGKLRKWSNTQTFNYELDSALVENDYTWTLPTDYYDKNSNRSMLQIWLEDQDNLSYIDKLEFDDYDRDTAAGTPKFFTIYDGSVYITPKVHADYAGDSIYMDYYTDISEVNSDADEITLARHDMIKHWLKWAVRNITEKNGVPDYADGDWLMFQQILEDAKRRESSGQKSKWAYRVSGITYRGSQNVPFEES